MNKVIKDFVDVVESEPLIRYSLEECEAYVALKTLSEQKLVVTDEMVNKENAPTPKQTLLEFSKINPNSPWYGLIKVISEYLEERLK